VIFLLVLAALVAGAPLVAAVLVSVASLREDMAKSLAGQPPGPLAAAARRLVRASVGGMGSLKRPVPVRRPAAGRRSYRRQRATRTASVGAPLWPAADEEATHSYGALAAPEASPASRDALDPRPAS
jgi:hypothetical protein